MIIIRLWHKDLIPYLPKNQLLGQWRECCCIARNIVINNTPNHILVNKILNYPTEHFITYTCYVYKEMKKRGYRIDWNKFQKYSENHIFTTEYNRLFKNWHNDRYLKQCLYNLQEKYDCDGISQEEWDIIENKFKEYF